MYVNDVNSIFLICFSGYSGHTALYSDATPETTQQAMWNSPKLHYTYNRLTGPSHSIRF